MDDKELSRGRVSAGAGQVGAGGFFVVSAGFKLVAPELFAAQIGAFGLLWSPFIPLAVWGLIGLELCAGVAVIANRRWDCGW